MRAPRRRSAQGPVLGGAEAFNPRQAKTLNRLLDGFEGKLTSSKWAKMNSSQNANRDIRDLIDRGILARAKPAGAVQLDAKAG